MKKIYNQPTCLVVELGSHNAFMGISANNESTGLSGTNYGGKTSDIIGGSVSADTKSVSDVNLWDNEW